MAEKIRYRTAESVTEGQSDKLADQISDAVVDAILEGDKNASIACETLITNGFCVVAGEITTETYAPITEIARNVFRECGYTDGGYGFDYRSAGVITAVNDQSAELAAAKSARRGSASDSCAAVGFACDETAELMPLECVTAHKLTRALANARKDGSLPFLLSDGKAQVSVSIRDGEPPRVSHIVISAQHARSRKIEEVREGVFEEAVKKVLSEEAIGGAKIEINPSGCFVIGGPQCDTGLTGRKAVSDSYGMAAAHGGGALCGKDPLKIDRAGSYMARYLAKNIVASGMAKSAEIALTYAISLSSPISVSVKLNGESADSRLAEFILENFDLSAGAIAKRLDLFAASYKSCAVYGAFGREGFGWEKLDSAAIFKKFAGF